MKIHGLPAIYVPVLLMTAGLLNSPKLYAQNGCPPDTICIPKERPAKDNPPPQDQGPGGKSQAPRIGHGRPPDIIEPPVTKQTQSGQSSFPRTPEIQGRPVPVPQYAAPPADVAERALQRKIGPDKFNQVMDALNGVSGATGAGRGAPNADRFFDGAPPRTGNDDRLQPAGTRFFGSGGASAIKSGTFQHATQEGAQHTLHNYGTIPGGIVLEGKAAIQGSIGPIGYNARLNALTFGDAAAYFSPVSPLNLVLLCRSIARDDRVGVSLGKVHIVYGALPPNSDVATDLKLADHFLGDIVFARKDWTAGYRFANGFDPQPHQGEDFYGAVFFNFNGFTFTVNQEAIQATKSNVDVQIVPLSNNKASDGGHLPDFGAISAGRTSSQWEANARHVAQNIDYYSKEKIIDRVYRYGEVAALLRGLKAANVDLERIALTVESAVGATAGGADGPAPSDSAAKLESDWEEYLKQIQAHYYYENWSGPPYDLYRNARMNSFVSYLHRDLPGNDLQTIRNITWEACSSQCKSTTQCKAYSFDRWNRWCYLKSAISMLTVEPRSVSAVRRSVTQPQSSDAAVQMYRYRQKAFREGRILRRVDNVSLDRCEGECAGNGACIAYTFFKGPRQCMLLADAGEYFPNSGADSGAKQQDQ